MRPRAFLLSPAHAGGLRATQLVEGDSPLARRLRAPAGAPLGEVFAWLSALYFRGKLAYANAFARTPADFPFGGGQLVITPGAGLLPAMTPIHAEHLRAFAAVEVDADNPAFARPLARDARVLRAFVESGGEVVLLGSIATAKYVEPLVSVLGERLLFPPDFVGRGDMSRGGLCLRCARAGQELAYAPVAGAVRTGPRPPRLPRVMRR